MQFDTPTEDRCKKEMQDLDRKYCEWREPLMWIEFVGDYLMLVVISILVCMLWRLKRKSSLEVKILASMSIYYALGAFFKTDYKIFDGKAMGDGITIR